MRLALAAIALLALLSSGPRVVAAPAGAARPGLLVLRLEHEGLAKPLSSALEAAVRREVEAALVKGRLLPAPALDLESMQLAAGCSSDAPPCLASIGRTLGATQVLRVRLSGGLEKSVAEVSLVQVSSAKVQRSEVTLGELDAESGPELGWVAARLLNPSRAAPAGALTLAPASGTDLLGAELLLDDRAVSAQALATLEPGRHRLDVKKKGFEGFIWIGEVRPGRSQRVEVRLEPRVAGRATVETPPIGARSAADADRARVGATVEPGPAPRSSRVVTWVLAGGTLVAAGVGGIFGARVLSLEDEASTARLDCAGADFDADTCASGRTSATVANVGWAVAGGLLVASAVAFFVEAPDEREPATQIGLAPRAGGAEATLRVRF
jgi:hypothetical protein